MALPKDAPQMTEAEYLEFERHSDLRHEYIAGGIYAMTGASRWHNIISSNINTQFNLQLQNRPCEVYQSDMRVKVKTAQLYTYPDVVVVYDPPQFSDDEFDTLLNPTVLIKVLSPSTANYDRGKKLQEYQQITTVQEYLLVAQDEARIERYLRQETSRDWLYRDVRGLDAKLELPSIQCTLALADVYRKVSFEPEGGI